jgi:tellurite resistance protein TerC
VLLGADLILSAYRNRPARLGEAALWTATAIGLALGFGALLAGFASRTAAGQFYAGWLTEYSLSLDNLIVFALLIKSSKVPARLHGRVLMLGICLALVLRGIFIAAGAAALQRFDWLQYLFGAFLLGTAVWMARQRGNDGKDTAQRGDSRGTRWFGKGQPPPGRAGPLARVTRRLRATPFLLLVIAIGVTDVMFALDSIPAIFGLTRDPFVVFTANLFALIGLRHLYFLVGGLLQRLVHLSVGIAAVLAFIGIKFLSEALRSSGVHHVGPLPVPHFSAVISLSVIVGVMAVTAGASLALSSRGQRPPGVLTGAGAARAEAGNAPHAGTHGKPAGVRSAANLKLAAQSNIAGWRNLWDHTKPPDHNQLPSHSLACHNNFADRGKLGDSSRLGEFGKLGDPNKLPAHGESRAGCATRDSPEWEARP